MESPLYNVHLTNEKKPHHILHSVKHFQKGLKDEEPITVDEILEDSSLQDENNYVQVSGIVRLDSSPERIIKHYKIQT